MVQPGRRDSVGPNREFSGLPRYQPSVSAVTGTGGFFYWSEGMLTAERARELLAYDPETGWLVRKSKRGGSSVGDRAGWVNRKKSGYRSRHIRVDGKIYLEHRLIWFIVTGSWPNPEIDHENHDATDNRWKNLREVNVVDNARNYSRRSDNPTGVTGVTWHECTSTYRVRIKAHGKDKPLGFFKEFEKAVAARKAAEIEYSYHINHGAEKGT